jgi:phospholipid transport system substrate-binding protein
MRFSLFQLPACIFLVSLLGLVSVNAAQAPDPDGPPEQFVLSTANEALSALKQDEAVKAGDLARVNALVAQYILPYVDFQKTTRLAAGPHWRQATPQQREALAEAFRGALIRTYSGALPRLDKNTTVALLPSRYDSAATDVVVRSRISQTNGQPVQVDYRLEKTPQGWKIYDLNVEGIWLIENYRNQFTQQISQSGIDGLIQALNARNH